MGINGLLTTSASGMSAQSALLNTVSDNIANASTTGYKRASAEFASLVLDAGASDYQSGSVLVNPRIAIDGQGAINSTSTLTNLAIQGDGFFMVQAANGSYALTRAGAFQKDDSGNLVNTAGYTLMAQLPGSGTGAANGFGGLVPVNLNTGTPTAEATSSGTFTVNLPSTATIVAAADLPSAYAGGTPLPQTTNKTSLIVYDYLGAPVSLDIYTSKTADNTWEVDVYDSRHATSGGFPYQDPATAALDAPTTLNLTFDPTKGTLLTSPATIDFPLTGGKPISIDMAASTQLATNYQVIYAKADGSAPTQPTNYRIDKDGTLSALYEDGTVTPLYVIQLATVKNPNGLVQNAGNAFVLGPKSGDLLRGYGGDPGFGMINSSSLEASTVDLGTELTTMIQAQNNYQANSKVFNTGSTLLQVLINLGH
jgi:flagellar hook protein FlgE